MDKTEAKIFAAELGAKMPQLDLHEKYPHEIEDELRLFVLENYNLDKEMVRIVYGGGQGKMREKVLQLLENEPLKKIIERVEAREGSCVAVFKQ